jgi:hypothetical protein
MPDSRQIPKALNIVALLFLLEGLGAIFGIAAAIHAGGFKIDLNILGVPVCFGLRRFSRGWRTCALVLIWLGLIGYPILFVVGLTASRPIELTIFFVTFHQVGPFWLPVVFILMFLLTIWQYRVLKRRDVLALFDLAGPAESTILA